MFKLFYIAGGVPGIETFDDMDVMLRYQEFLEKHYEDGVVIEMLKVA